MQLSSEAIKELKEVLVQKYGSVFGLSDEELNEIGELLLTALAEGLKQRVASPELFTPKV